MVLFPNPFLLAYLQRGRQVCSTLAANLHRNGCQPASQPDQTILRGTRHSARHVTKNDFLEHAVVLSFGRFRSRLPTLSTSRDESNGLFACFLKRERLSQGLECSS